MECDIRPINPNETPILKEFLYEAIFQREGDEPAPKSVIEQPEVAIYIADFGKEDDSCLVSVVDGRIVGAVWTRILFGEVKGFGNVDEQTPEFAISLYGEYRGKGIGTALMLAMLKLLREKGYEQTSLAVQKDNYAVDMYKKVGFSVVGENEQEYIMLCKL